MPSANQRIAGGRSHHAGRASLRAHAPMRALPRSDRPHAKTGSATIENTSRNRMNHSWPTPNPP